MKSIMVLSTRPEIGRTVQDSLGGDVHLDALETVEAALDQLGRRHYDCLLADLGLIGEGAAGGSPRTSIRDALSGFWRQQTSLKIVVMAPVERLREAIAAVKAGAEDFLAYPVDPEHVQRMIEDIYQQRLMHSELEYLRDQFWQAGTLEDVHTRSALMRRLFGQVRAVAPTQTTVLITGETGTGKTWMAKLIHAHSHRRRGPFISVHCGAVPDTLLESELFGHEKGAFTGAIRRKLGKFELARGGTLLLDEIGTITPAAQIKLLTVLQEGIFQRVGGESDIQADVRIIAATNSDLRALVDEGRFRKDLFYRLNVFPLEMPPLRLRLEDLPMMLETLLERYNRLNNKSVRQVDPRVMAAMQAYPWPGNIRELENLVERAHILEASDILSADSFPAEMFAALAESVPAPIEDIPQSGALAEVRQRAVAEIERRYLKGLLMRHRGRIDASAAEAGVSTRQLNNLMTKYALRKADFRHPGEAS